MPIRPIFWEKIRLKNCALFESRNFRITEGGGYKTGNMCGCKTGIMCGFKTNHSKKCAGMNAIKKFCNFWLMKGIPSPYSSAISQYQQLFPWGAQNPHLNRRWLAGYIWRGRAAWALASSAQTVVLWQLETALSRISPATNYLQRFFTLFSKSHLSTFFSKCDDEKIIIQRDDYNTSKMCVYNTSKVGAYKTHHSSIWARHRPL